MKEYHKKYKNVIKLYQYNINVSKVGIEHKNAIDNNNKNTLGTFYNWCLSKATRYNVFKWDADFICIRNNFIQLINKYNLKNRDDKFAIWFTGKTLFEDNNEYYLNNNSFYNEYRIFSYKNNFCWYDGNTCEYTDPYIESCHPNNKYKFEQPLFYEIKRTSLDEFKERSSLIDNRDIADFEILNSLKKDKNNNDDLELIKINKNIINSNKKIIIYTPSLSLGGGNQFIINIYQIYKLFGFHITVVPQTNNNMNTKKNNYIIDEDICSINKFNIDFINKINPDFIFFNSDIPFQTNDIIQLNKISKIIFITHSDVAYSNCLIEKYNHFFYKIITVNNYTIQKLKCFLNIESKKCIKVINYSEIDKNNDIMNQRVNKKMFKFGIISYSP
jgi:hypothetical protein